MVFNYIVTLLIALVVSCGAETQATASVVASCRLGETGGTEICANEDTEILESAILQDISASLAGTEIETDGMCVPRGFHDMTKAIRDFSPEADDKGQLAWRFLRGMANSETFVKKYWHQRPLLIRAAKTGGWVEGSFTVDRDLR
jgi:hypothetical protein